MLLRILNNYYTLRIEEKRRRNAFFCDLFFCLPAIAVSILRKKIRIFRINIRSEVEKPYGISRTSNYDVLIERIYTFIDLPRLRAAHFYHPSNYFFT